MSQVLAFGNTFREGVAIGLPGAVLRLSMLSVFMQLSTSEYFQNDSSAEYLFGQYETNPAVIICISSVSCYIPDADGIERVLVDISAYYSYHALLHPFLGSPYYQ